MTGIGASRSWHIDADSLRRWVDGVAGPLVSASVEQHVLRCAQCRADVARLVDQAPLAAVWDNVLSAVEVRRVGFIQRLLVRVGLSPSDSLLIGAAGTYRVAWLAGVVAVLCFAVLAALFAHDGGVGLFLIAAPLAPVAGVAAAYGPSADPAFETVQAAPYALVRLIALRSMSVLIACVPLTVMAGLLLPTASSVAVAWLLPAVGFIVSVLTASAWVDPVLAALVVAVGWISCVLLAVRGGDPLVLFAPSAVLAYLVLLVVAGLILLHRLIGSAPSWRLR